MNRVAKAFLDSEVSKPNPIASITPTLVFPQKEEHGKSYGDVVLSLKNSSERES